MRLVQTGNVGVAEYLDKTNNKKWISEDTFDRLHCEEVLPGDILISRLPEPAGRACIVPLLGTKMITAVDCTIVRTAPDMSNKFLVQYLSSQAYFDDVNTCLAGGTRQRISRGNLANFNVPIPVKKSEQDAIGMFFGYLDNLITLHQRQPFLQSPPDISLIVQLTPPFYTFSWEQRKLGEVGTTYTGLSGKTKEDFGHGNGQFVTYMNVFSNPVGLPDMTEAVEIDDSQNKVLFGDVLFTTSSETPEEVGMSSVWLENAENTYLNSFCFGYRPTVKFNPYYLAYMLRSSSMRKKITFLAQGISRYNISKNKMMDIEIPIPNIEEQKQIGAFFKHLDKLITLHQRQTIVYAVIRSIRKVILAERQYFAPPMVRKSP